MILGLGLDVVALSRIARSWEKFGMRFAEKILHPDEMARLESSGGNAPSFLASRFAVKEASVKALGTGFSGGIGPTDISVATLPGGQPELHFHNKAEERFRETGAVRAHISLSHERETVAAVVILEK